MVNTMKFLLMSEHSFVKGAMSYKALLVGVFVNSFLLMQKLAGKIKVGVSWWVSATLEKEVFLLVINMVRSVYFPNRMIQVLIGKGCVELTSD